MFVTRFSRGWLMALAAVLATAGTATAQPIGTMLDECSRVAQSYFRDYQARTDMKYNGQRVDGTYAINGRIFLETRAEDFACSYAPSGRQMVEFYAEGRVRNAYLPGGGGSGGSSGGGAQGGAGMMQVTGVSGNDVLNVRSGPGTNYAKIGALSNGARVRSLGCRTEGSTQWCQIEQLDDMRSRGWVSARYLTAVSGSAQQLPSTGADSTSTVRVRFAAGTSSASYQATLQPGASIRYVLGARNGQYLDVSLATNGRRVSYQIFNPDRSMLNGMSPSSQPYRGQLWQNGDHVVEVVNRGNRAQSVSVYFGIN